MKSSGFADFFERGPGQLLTGGLSFGKILGVLVGLVVGIPLVLFILKKLRGQPTA